MKKIDKEKLDFYGIKYEIDTVKKEQNKTINNKLESKYLWIIRNLSIYKNCFVNEDTFSDLDFGLMKQILEVDEINYHPILNNDDSVSSFKAGYVLYI